MPSNMLNNDTMFPTFTEEQSSGEKIDLILNYLRMLVEQLRYSTYNLGVDNFNDAELNELEGSSPSRCISSCGTRKGILPPCRWRPAA